MLREYCVTPTSIITSKDKDNWTVLDSDGEDDEGAFVAEAPLRENDYVNIFNQFPLESLFKYLFKIEPGMDFYDVDRFTTTSFFKLFAFGTYFVNLLKGKKKPYFCFNVYTFTKKRRYSFYEIFQVVYKDSANHVTNSFARELDV